MHGVGFWAFQDKEQMSNINQAMLNRYGYIDRRDQKRLAADDRLTPLPGAADHARSCEGCAYLHCTCGRHSTASSRQSESSRQATIWESVRASYAASGFCPSCAAQAAYGHQLGFSQVPSVCDSCRGRKATWRRAGDGARRWTGETPASRGRSHIGAQAA